MILLQFGKTDTVFFQKNNILFAFFFDTIVPTAEAVG